MYLKEIHCEDLNKFHQVEDVYNLRDSLSIIERICWTAESLITSRDPLYFSCIYLYLFCAV